MGRPKRFDREKALETVMHEIWQHGYEACSVKSIAEKLGITRSSFYNTFGTREALFLEVLQRYFEQAPDIRLNDVDGSRPVLSEICQVFYEACKARTSDPLSRGCLAVNCVAELVHVNEELGPHLEEAMKKSIQRFEHLLKLAAQQGEIDSEDIKNKALSLQNLLVGLSVLSKVVSSFEELWRTTEYTLVSLGLYRDFERK